MVQVEFEIIEHFFPIGVEDDRGFQKELNCVSWNGKIGKYDLRGWDKTHKKMTKGITFQAEELSQLRDELNRFNIEKGGEKHDKTY